MTNQKIESYSLHQNKAVIKPTIFEHTPVKPKKCFHKNFKDIKQKTHPDLFSSYNDAKICLAHLTMQYGATKPIKHGAKKN